MHEYSIVQALIDSCEDNAKQNEASKVTKVVVKIGVMSGVEPHLLEIAFDTFKDGTMCADAEFIMNIQQIKVLCENCSKENELKKLEYLCPNCGSDSLKVVDGEDMYLMQLELE